MRPVFGGRMHRTQDFLRLEPNASVGRTACDVVDGRRATTFRLADCMQSR
jgi:hypothetical protein